MRSFFLLLGLAAWPLAAPALAHNHGPAMMDGHESAPLHFFLRANRLDHGPSQEGARGSWDVDGRFGTDENRLVLKTEGDLIKGRTKHAEGQLLYARPIDEFFDMQIGVRQVVTPISRSYLAIGVQGTAPGFIETEATLFLSQKGQISARVKAEIDLAWTADIHSVPMVELTANGSPDQEMGLYAGIGSVRVALQTRYQLTRQIAPYVEIGWEKEVGQTGQRARARDERGENAYAVLGIRLLY